MNEREDTGKEKKNPWEKKFYGENVVGKSSAPGLVNRDDRLSFNSFLNIYRLFQNLQTLLTVESFKTAICSPFLTGCKLIFKNF